MALRQATTTTTGKGGAIGTNALQLARALSLATLLSVVLLQLLAVTASAAALTPPADDAIPPPPDLLSFLVGANATTVAVRGPSEGEAATTLAISEVQHKDRSGGPDWIELVNYGHSSVDLAGVAIRLRSANASVADLVRFGSEGCEAPDALAPGGFLLVIGQPKTPAALLPFYNKIYSRYTPETGSVIGAGPQYCRDVRPSYSNYSCKKQKEWSKCQEPWMIQGGYCAKTCGRCTSNIRSFTKAAGDGKQGIAACKFARNLQRSGGLSLTRDDSGRTLVLDEASWFAPREDTAGYTVGRPQSAGGGEDKAALSLLLEPTPGAENSGELTFGPMGPHWSGAANPMLNDAKGTKEYAFKSNLPLAIVKSARGIPNDPKTASRMWMSGCTEYETRTKSDAQDHTISLAVRNKDNVICTLRDKPAYDGLAGIELRGRSSQRYPKKQYGFEVWDESHEGVEIPMLGMPAEEDWILGAPYVDRSLMRDALGFDMYRDMGRWAPRMSFIELFVMENDGTSDVSYDRHYKGIYLLKEKIKRGSDRVAVSKMDPANATDVSGGYLLVLSSNSHDSMLATGEPPKAKVLDEGPARVSYVYPKKPTPGQQAYISAYLEDFQQALWSPQFAHPEFGYAKYIDVDSWVDYFLHTEMTKNLDGYISSVYLHKDKDGKLFAGPAWDYNLAFGQATYWSGYYKEPWDFTYIGPNQKSYSQMVHWYYKLVQDPGFRRRLALRYRELRQGEWRDAKILDKIRKYKSLLSGAQNRNFAAWPINHVSTHHKYIPIKYWGSTWNENVNGLQSWVLRRLQWMDEWVPKLGS